MNSQRHNLLGFASIVDEPQVLSYNSALGTDSTALKNVPDALLAKNPNLITLKGLAKDEREKAIIENLPHIFNKQGLKLAANLMNYWLHEKSYDGKRSWDYHHGTTKGVLLRDDEVRYLVSEARHERLRNAIYKLHKKFLEPSNGILSEFSSRSFSGIFENSLRASKQSLYTYLKSMKEGENKTIGWGETIFNPELYISYEEVDYLQLPSKNSKYYPIHIDDLSASLGRFGVRAYASGELSRTGSTGIFNVSKVGIRLFDQFKFESSIVPLLSQPLGNWSNNGLENIVDHKGVNLNDATFVKYREKFNRGSDFFVYSKIYEFNELSSICNILHLKSIPAFLINISEKDVLQYTTNQVHVPKY
ncbi:DUF6402 family protein [Pontibacter pamirensis]|uniref:DUF6402 family protein n=1 Tax=Pontibacter pamirensis TaxID=2562824 RepID=UPI001389F27D|nr:DUF6402 family protein [Pontibacter pamirensis]